MNKATVALLTEAMRAFSANVEQAARAWAASVPGYELTRDAAVEYQHARIVAGVLCPWRAPDNPQPILGAMEF